MGDYYGRYLHRRCHLCNSIHPVDGPGPYGQSFIHKCDSTKANCSECGLMHDGYSASSIGYSPCLAAIHFELNEMKSLIRRFAPPNAMLEYGRQVAQELEDT